jgi:hypothetical protein
MNIFTKATLKTIPLVAVMAFSLVIEAKSSGKEKADKKVEVKCFVELVGGGETISFWHIPNNKVSNLAKSIAGHKITVPNSKQKVQIYKTHECVLSKENFIGSRAKAVDSKMAR